MNRYQDYTVEDFIQDQKFNDWILNPNNNDTDRFWNLFLSKYPNKKAEVEQAKRFILLMKFKETSVPDHDIDRLKSKIDESINFPLLIPHKYKSQKANNNRPILSYAVAAVITLLILAVSILKLTNNSQIQNNSPLVDAQGVKQEHVSKKGKRSVILLDDGTKVWLNADSKISYNKNFNASANREVILEGEAFFDVAKNPNKPFIVHVSPIAIRVMGTSFNVKSYQSDEYVETTLVEGKVVIELNEDGDPKTTPPIETTLFPNQQARYSKENKRMELDNRIDIEEYIGWRSGKLYFADRPITEVVNMLERWYDVDINLKSKPSSTCLFSGKLDNMTLEEVLELFKISDGISYTISEDLVVISGDLCNE